MPGDCTTFDSNGENGSAVHRKNNKTTGRFTNLHSFEKLGIFRLPQVSRAVFRKEHHLGVVQLYPQTNLLKQEPSAQRPWQNTMPGLACVAVISNLPS
jgi:hypothetical protein